MASNPCTGALPHVSILPITISRPNYNTYTFWIVNRRKERMNFNFQFGFVCRFSTFPHTCSEFVNSSTCQAILFLQLFLTFFPFLSSWFWCWRLAFVLLWHYITLKQMRNAFPLSLQIHWAFIYLFLFFCFAYDFLNYSVGRVYIGCITPFSVVRFTKFSWLVFFHSALLIFLFLPKSSPIWESGQNNAIFPLIVWFNLCEIHSYSIFYWVDILFTEYFLALFT